MLKKWRCHVKFVQKSCNSALASASKTRAEYNGHRVVQLIRVKLTIDQCYDKKNTKHYKNSIFIPMQEDQFLKIPRKCILMKVQNKHSFKNLSKCDLSVSKYLNHSSFKSRWFVLGSEVKSGDFHPQIRMSENQILIIFYIIPWFLLSPNLK